MHWFQSQLLNVFTHVYVLSFLFSMFISESSCSCHEHSMDQGKGQEQNALDISECKSFLALLKSSAASNVRYFASNANKSHSMTISSFLLGKNSSEASEARSRALDTQRQRGDTSAQAVIAGENGDRVKGGVKWGYVRLRAFLESAESPVWLRLNRSRPCCSYQFCMRGAASLI